MIIYMKCQQRKIYHKETEKEVTPAGVFSIISYKILSLKQIMQRKESSGLKNFRMSGMANSDGDILNKLEAPDGDFSVYAPVRSEKVRGTI